MASIGLDPKTENEDVGSVITRSHKIPAAGYDTNFGFFASVIKVEVAGTVVWYNKFTGEEGAWVFEAGEAWPIACTEIRTSATIDGQAYSTTVPAAQIWVAATANRISNL